MKPTRRTRHSLLALALWTACAVGGGFREASAQVPGAYAGRSLAQVLEELRTQGLPLLFTSELVPPDLRIEREPAEREGRALVAALLAPHGLQLRESPGGIWVVMRRPAPESAAAGQPDGPLNGNAFAESISVHSSRLALFEEQPESTLTLRREEIEGLPHLGGDLLRATSLLPGVAANDVSARPSVRAGRPDELKILLDGQELYDPFHLQDYDSALSVVSARTLGTASLSTGNFAPAHGDRLGGVLDLTSFDPDDEREFALGLSVLDAIVSAAGRSPRSTWLTSLRRGSLDLAERAIGTEQPRYWDGFAKLDLSPSPAHRFGFRALVAADRLSLDRSSPEDSERFSNHYRSKQAWATHSRQAARWTLLSTVSWADIDRRRGGEVVEEEGAFELSDLRSTSVIGGSQQATLDLAERQILGSQLALLGFEFRRYETDFDFASTLDPEFVIAAPFALPRTNIRRFDNLLRRDHLGLWISDRFHLGPRLTLELGLRHDRHTAPHEQVTSPRVNLAFVVPGRSGGSGEDNPTVLRAGWGRFAQSQRPSELGVEDGLSVIEPIEVSEHTVVGLEHRFSRQLGGVAIDALRIEWFDRRVSDPRRRAENLVEPLNFFPEIEPDRVVLEPLESSARGFEAVVKGSAGRVEGWLTISFAKAEERFAHGSVPRALDQPRSLAVVLGCPLVRDWRLHVAWRYRSGWPTTPIGIATLSDPEDPDEEPEPTPIFGPLRSGRFADYQRLDLRLTREWKLRRGEFDFFVDVQNVTGRRNVAGFDVQFEFDSDGSRGDEEPRLVIEPEYWPRTFASLGFHWRF